MNSGSVKWLMYIGTVCPVGNPEQKKCGKWLLSLIDLKDNIMCICKIGVYTHLRGGGLTSPAVVDNH